MIVGHLVSADLGAPVASRAHLVMPGGRGSRTTQHGRRKRSRPLPVTGSEV